MPFPTKDEARRAVWDRLEAEGAARFPFPPHGRIPNFAGAREAAERLMDRPLLAGARRMKSNPDAPQLWVRRLALEHGIEVFVPTPRLKGGFRRLNPGSIPAAERRKAASLSHMKRWSEEVPVRELPAMDVVVAGSVAVTEDGRRCGKGEGYADLEYAVLVELGHPAPPVVTTVHSLQVVDGFPADAHDLPLALIVTPEQAIPVEPPAGSAESARPAAGIRWELLNEEDLEAMPVLRELRPESS